MLACRHGTAARAYIEQALTQCRLSRGAADVNTPARHGGGNAICVAFRPVSFGICTEACNRSHSHRRYSRSISTPTGPVCSIPGAIVAAACFLPVPLYLQLWRGTRAAWHVGWLWSPAAGPIGRQHGASVHCSNGSAPAAIDAALASRTANARPSVADVYRSRTNV